jgi:hypothetical protein
VMGEPHEEERPRSWEVYSAMPGIDSLHTGLSKRTPNGTHATILWHASIPAAHLSMRLPSPQAASSLRETASMCLSHGRAVSLHASAFCIPGEILVAAACSLLNLVVASMVVTRFARPLPRS